MDLKYPRCFLDIWTGTSDARRPAGRVVTSWLDSTVTSRNAKVPSTEMECGLDLANCLEVDHVEHVVLPLPHATLPVSY